MISNGGGVHDGKFLSVPLLIGHVVKIEDTRLGCGVVVGVWMPVEVVFCLGYPLSGM